MPIRIQFYSLLQDLARSGEFEKAVPEDTRIADLLAQLYGEFPRLREWDGRILVGVGVEFVERDYVLRDGDEVAIMPPVQGG